MKNLRNCYAAFLQFALLFVSAAAPAQTDLQQKLDRISAITETRPLESTRFSEKYVTYFTQPLDHCRPEKGSFRQRVIVSHVGFDRPTVIVTEGYGAAYALNPKYREELSELLDANMIFVEYRYFLESTPEPKDWQYLTAENSADDLHAVRNAFKSIYPGKWIATGISKGGQTTLLYRTFYPDDVDISVPYVAPLCYGAEDGRHEPFLRKVSTPEDRKRIEDFQLEVLKRKAALLPRFEKYCIGWSGMPGHLPESTSINKQITYGEYIAEERQFMKDGDHPVVYNAFIMPYDSKGKKFPTGSPIHYIGTATSDWKGGDKKYENVLGILMDVKYLMGIDSRADEAEIIKLAELIEENCPV